MWQVQIKNPDFINTEHCSFFAAQTRPKKVETLPLAVQRKV